MPGENRGILFSFACAIQKVDEDAVAFSIHPGKKNFEEREKLCAAVHKVSFFCRYASLCRGNKFQVVSEIEFRETPDGICIYAKPRWKEKLSKRIMTSSSNLIREGKERDIMISYA